MNSSEIKQLEKALKLWHDSKETITQLEKRFLKAKKYIEVYMEKNHLNTITVGHYQSKRRHGKRTIVVKENIPKSILDDCTKDISYTSYYIKKLKD